MQQAVTSLCWQRSKPVVVDERNCTAETALVGDAVEDSILMPDPLPSSTSSNISLNTSMLNSRNSGRVGASIDATSFTTSGSGFPNILSAPTAEETPQRNHLWPGGTLSRLHAPRGSYNLKDDMEVFSPLVDVQPLTPSLWDENGIKKDNLFSDRKPMLFPSSSRRFSSSEEGISDHPISDWKSGSSSKQDITQSSFQLAGSTPPPPSSKTEDSSITPPEAWGGERLSEKYAYPRQPVNVPSRFGMLASGGQSAGSMLSGLQDTSSSVGVSSYASSSLSFANLRAKDVSTSQETSLGFTDHTFSTSLPLSVNTKTSLGQTSIDSSKLLDSPRMSSFNRRFSTYAERISTTSTFSDGVSLSVSSPKIKKSGAETREELLNSLLLKSDISAPTESGSLPLTSGVISQQKASQPDAQGSSFTLQLFQRTLEETLDSFQKSIHEDMRNLHIEILRQFHMQETEMSAVMNSIMENQAELMKEVKSLRKENQQLRQML
ncbi:unnamed protein product [Sphenostylis stenocarpa]|uniref:Protein NEDD1 n=1 Tax=Sphenostylis stenocarpa TaxID=92480 RepID=A0AA86VJT1_9FABA|nr:unnamed protein product [Sphenostylis stenocarpa]